jgi:hypothetical protein
MEARSVKGKGTIWELMLAAGLIGFIHLLSNQKPNQRAVNFKDRANQHQDRNPEEKEHRFAERRYWRWQNRTTSAGLLLNAVTFVVAIAGAMIAYSAFQASRQAVVEAKRQADAAEESLWATQRPWIKVSMTLGKNIIFAEWANEKSIQIPLKLEYKNHGGAPAINLHILIVTDKRITDAKEIASASQQLCENVRAQSTDENSAGGITVFPGETEPVPNSIADTSYFAGTSRYWDAEGLAALSVYGCIDYAYGNGRHGQTAFRMLLGREVDGRIRGLPFVEGKPRPYDEPIPPELLATGFPVDPPKVAFMPTIGLIFERESLGGNYAK